MRRGLASGTLDTGCCLRITTWCAKLIRRRPGASGLYARATRINHLRAVRTGGAGQRALAPLAAYRVYCGYVWYGVRETGLSGVPYLPYMLRKVYRSNLTLTLTLTL